jgi:nucleotide-binding universal stress UspA family protein
MEAGMKILVAVDQNPYSAHVVGEVAKLAANTWANVTLLGTEPKIALKRGKGSAMRTDSWETDGPLPSALFAYRKNFLSFFKKEDSPYARGKFSDKLVEVKKGIWEELDSSKGAKKNLKVRIRIGNPGKEILAEANEEESDLIVLGCDNSKGCGWENGASVPRKVANEAACSVLVVKKEGQVRRIVCCLDHDRVSQQSLEMINQMVTLHGAKLTIVGLTENEGLKTGVENKMDNILRYYHARNIEPWIELVEISSLDSFVAEEAQWGLMALWMGKKSILENVFPRGKINKLIKGSDSSVLILR